MGIMAVYLFLFSSLPGQELIEDSERLVFVINNRTFESEDYAMFTKSQINIWVLVAAALTLWGCGQEADNQAVKESVRPVKMLSIGTASAIEVSRFPATISDNQLVELSFPAGGRVIELSVNNAQQLTKGQVIAKLDQRDIQNNLDTATAQYQNAEKEYKRARSLIKTNAIANSTLLQRKTDRDVSFSKLKSAQKALKDSTLVAPFDGVIAQKLVEEDQVVAGGAPVVIFIGKEEMEASIDVPARYLAELYQHENQKTKMEVYLSLDIAPETPLQAKYKSAVLLADTATQTYEVTFEFSAPENVLTLPGMNATIEVHVDADNDDNQVQLPINAVSRDGSSTYVWVVSSADMRVSKRQVTVMDGVGENLFVMSGLEKGETIVTSGVGYLYEGMKVREWY